MIPDPLEKMLVAFITGHVPEDISHGRGHVFRVVRVCKTIARALEKEGYTIDWNVLLVAAYLHDTGRLHDFKPALDVVPPGDLPHAERSVFFAREFIEKNSEFPLGLRGPVEKAVLAHSFSRGEVPDSIEGKVLSDADKIDALGAQGIIRTVAYSVEHGRSLEDTLAHFNGKILVLKDLMHTAPARLMAEQKHGIVAAFVADLVESSFKDGGTRVIP